MNKQRIKKMLDSHGYTIPKGIAFYDLNAYKKIANRQNSSEYLDDITALCQLEILADKIHDTQRKIKLALAATRRAARKKEIIQ